MYLSPRKEEKGWSGRRGHLEVVQASLYWDVFWLSSQSKVTTCTRKVPDTEAKDKLCNSQANRSFNQISLTCEHRVGKCSPGYPVQGDHGNFSEIKPPA